MRSQHRTHRGRRSSLNRPIAIAGAVIVMGALLAGFIYKVALEKGRPTLDKVTFCPVDGPKDVVAVLVDRTDGLNEPQAEDLSRHMITWATRVPVGGKFVVYEVGRGGRLLEPVISVCNPGDGAGSEGWASNPKQLKATYTEHYVQKITRMTEAMREDAEAVTSPIMEAVQAISIKEFGSDHPNLETRKLIIVSDLLQYVPEGLNLYKQAADYEAFAGTPYARSVQSRLNGAEFSMFGVRRDQAVAKQDKLAEFWRQWLRAQGGVFGEYTRISG